jgi:hypothetical protein
MQYRAINSVKYSVSISKTIFILRSPVLELQIFKVRVSRENAPPTEGYYEGTKGFTAKRKAV